MIEPASDRALSPRARRWARLALLAPAPVALARLALAWLATQNVEAWRVLGALAAVAWAIFVVTPRGGRLTADVAGAILAHVGFVALGLAAAAALVVAGAEVGGAEWLAGALALALLACAALVHGLETARAATRRKLVLVAINLGVLVALDFAVRALVLPSKSHNNLLVVHDPTLGWKLRPNTSWTNRNELFTARETINSLGFRTPERPFAKPAGTQRVLVLGDSHAEAYTVDDDETWLAHLERELARDLPVEVISLGVGGFSTDQELLAYLHVGRRFAPDVVVLQTCANDPEFNVLDHYWRGRKPRFERHGDALFLTGVPVVDLRSSGVIARPLLELSGVALLVETIARQAAIRRDVEVEADPEEAWRVTELLVRDLARLVRADGAVLAGLDVSTRNVAEHRRFREIFAREGMASLDVDPMYLDEWKSYFHEGHWNEKGQRAAALALAPQVRELLASRAGEAPRPPRARAIEASASSSR